MSEWGCGAGVWCKVLKPRVMALNSAVRFLMHESDVEKQDLGFRRSRGGLRNAKCHLCSV